MPRVPWMEGIFQSDVHKGESASSATARASTLLFSWPWWMEIPSSCGWTWGQPGQLHMLRFSSTPDFRHKIEEGSIGFPDSESLGIGGLFPSWERCLSPHALANEALLQPH